MARGLFFSLDGLDGCGKTTQCRRLVEHLRADGHSVVTCVDPGGTPLGSQLRELLLHRRQEIAVASEALLFMASRAQLVHEVINPALAEGAIVLADRFLLANVVYQGHAGGLDPDLVWQAGQLSTGGLQPDLTWVLDLPVEQAVARRCGPADRVEGRDLDYHRRVRQGFLFEAARQPECMRVIDAAQSADTVFEAMCASLAPFDLARGRGS